MRTLYRGGRVLRCAETPIDSATALLVDGAVIDWVGLERDTAGLARDREIDLAGGLVTPAFVDAHVHATSTGLALLGLDLSSARSSREVLDQLARAVRTARGRPILGGGWDESRWDDPRPPSRTELDRAAFGGSVYLARVDVHSALVSSALLAAVPGAAALAGYSADGWVRRDAHDAVRSAAYGAISPAQRRDAQRAALDRAAALGIACVHEMAGPAISSADDLAALLRMAAEQPVPDVVGYWGELFGIETARGLGAIGAGGDLFCDGSLGSHTAALHEPYADRPELTGTLRFATSDVTEHIRRCVRAGLQAGFHAIGDAAVDQVLDAVAAAGGPQAGRWVRLEHAEMVTDPRRLAELGITASVQPVFDREWGGPDRMYAQRLGADRAVRLNDLAGLAEAGVPLAFGSDAPVTELGPWAAVRAATTTRHPGSSLPVAAAFAAHTAGGRVAARQQAQALAVGAPATFAVWRTSESDRTAELPDLADGQPLPECLRTVRAGRTIYAIDQAAD